MWCGDGMAKVILDPYCEIPPEDPENCFEDAIASIPETEKNSYRSSSKYLLPALIDIGYLFKHDASLCKLNLTQSIIQTACVKSGIRFLELNKEIADYKNEKKYLRYSPVGQSHKFIDIIDNGKFDYRFKYDITFRTPKNLFNDVRSSKQIADLSSTLNLSFAPVMIETCLIGAYRLLSSRENSITHHENYNKVYEEISHFLQVTRLNKVVKLKLEFYDAKFNDANSTLTFSKLSSNPTLTIIKP